MVARTAALLMLLLLAGCGTPASMYRIALLGPFEGRYREIGYDAYYAAKLALSDEGDQALELLALDDGGTPDSARARAVALAADPRVKAVLLTGYAAATTDTQQALGAALPAIIIGQWGSTPVGDNRFMLASADLPPESREITEMARLNGDIVGGEIFGLKQFALLGGDTPHAVIVTNAALADSAFRERLLNSGLYIPEPGLLSTLSYDAARMAAAASRTSSPADTLRNMRYEGLNGTIHFENGYWSGAPLHAYRYDSDCLQSSKQLCLIEAAPPA